MTVSIRIACRALRALATAASAACIIHPPTARAQTRSCAGVHQLATDSAALAFEQTWAAAAATHDTTALGCMLADDFIDTSWRGELRSRREVLTNAPTAPPGLRQHFSDWRVSRSGTTAIIRGLNTITDSSNRTVSTLRFTDVLIYSSGRWQAIAAEETVVEPAAPSGRQ